MLTADCGLPMSPPTNIKCILLGSSGIGKTSLVVSYTTNDYPNHHKPSALDTFCVEVSADNRPVRLLICDAGGAVEASSLRQLSYPGVHVVLLCFSVIKPDSFRALREQWLAELAESLLVLNSSIERLINTNSSSRCQDNHKHTEEHLRLNVNPKTKSGFSSRGSQHSGVPGPAFLLVGCACDLRHDIGQLLELSKHGGEPVDKKTAELFAAEIGAEAYVECSALTQKNLKTVFDLAIWCGLRVANAGGPAHKDTSNLANGNGSIVSHSLPRKSSPHYPAESNTTNHGVSSQLAHNVKPDKSFWRKFLCVT